MRHDSTLPADTLYFVPVFLPGRSIRSDLTQWIFRSPLPSNSVPKTLCFQYLNIIKLARLSVRTVLINMYIKDIQFLNEVVQSIWGFHD